MRMLVITNCSDVIRPEIGGRVRTTGCVEVYRVAFVMIIGGVRLMLYKMVKMGPHSELKSRRFSAIYNLTKLKS